MCSRSRSPGLVCLLVIGLNELVRLLSLLDAAGDLAELPASAPQSVRTTVPSAFVTDPDAFSERLRGSRYDWGDLQRLLRSSDRIEPADILAAVEDRFGVLRGLTDLEQQLVADARSGWNEPLAERLRAEIRGRHVERERGPR